MNEFIFKLFSKRVNRQIGADTVPLPSAAPVRPISAGETNSNRKKRLINNHFIYRQNFSKASRTTLYHFDFHQSDEKWKDEE
jgi:hypothetical protein